MGWQQACTNEPDQTGRKTHLPAPQWATGKTEAIGELTSADRFVRIMAMNPSVVQHKRASSAAVGMANSSAGFNATSFHRECPA
jgi:hypothetical protein